MLATVVNIKKQEYDVYIGRPSIFGNPFVIGYDGDRSEVIEKYRSAFYQRLKYDSEFRGAIEGLRGKRLGCYCHPLPCHGDIIAEYLNKS